MSDTFKNLSETLDLDNDLEAIAEGLKLDFAMELESLLRREGISYKQLAERLGSSGAYVSKVMRGDTNLTIESLAKLAFAANARIHIQVMDVDSAKLVKNERLFGIMGHEDKSKQFMSRPSAVQVCEAPAPSPAYLEQVWG